jgi:hypothetical protein
VKELRGEEEGERATCVIVSYTPLEHRERESLGLHEGNSCFQASERRPACHYHSALARPTLSPSLCTGRPHSATIALYPAYVAPAASSGNVSLLCVRRLACRASLLRSVSCAFASGRPGRPASSPVQQHLLCSVSPVQRLSPVQRGLCRTSPLCSVSFAASPVKRLFPAWAAGSLSCTARLSCAASLSLSPLERLLRAAYFVQPGRAGAPRTPHRPWARRTSNFLTPRRDCPPCKGDERRRAAAAAARPLHRASLPPTHATRARRRCGRAAAGRDRASRRRRRRRVSCGSRRCGGRRHRRRRRRGGRRRRRRGCR